MSIFTVSASPFSHARVKGVCPLSPIINCQKIKSQYRNSTPDITRIHSKTNSYFNIDRNNLEDNYINNKNKTPLNNYIREKTENYNHDTDRNNLITKPNLSITRNNSINYIFRKKTSNNKEPIQNKSNLNKKKELP